MVEPHGDTTSFDDLDLGIVTLDRDRRVVRWNRWIAEHSGIADADARGRRFFDLFPRIAESRLSHAVDDALDSGMSSVVSHYLNPELLPLDTEAAGGRQDVHQSIVVRPLGSGTCLLQVYDISAAVRREQQLRQGRAARYRAIVDTATDAIVTVDEAGLVQTANRAAASLFDCSESELVGTAIARRITPFIEGRARVERAGGGEVHVDISITRWTAEGRNFYTAIMRDVSARIEMERTIIAAKEEAVAARIAAEQANRAKSKFLAAATHDLRQPVQSLMLFSSALGARAVDERSKTLVGHMDHALNALKGLLDSLLDISKLDAGIVTAKVEATDLGPLLASIDHGFRPIAEAKGLAWSVEGPAQMTVRSDATLLGRMIRNLVENAIRYTDRGAVRVMATAEEAHLRVTVTDTGIGIPPESLDEIFTEFHQLANPERDQKLGLGLGLAIVRRLSQLLDHPVEVRSTPGQGSTFTITVPLEPSEGDTVAADPAPVAANGRTVVVIEDNAVVLMGLQGILEQWGYRVLPAESCDDALQALDAAGSAPDAIVADYRLRHKRTGTEAIRTIRARYGSAIPGLMLTGENSPDCLHDGRTEGFAILHKPIEPEQLRYALGAALGPDASRH
ncbi:PAS domain-containing hybrid sensor histidine kinase/response regulator [Azospirillum sp. ST 5-10]|uniref:PAS domain-containing hybrid sensor histidine kinase/response regulator n=1 Tax=unclassified Azospirillum TaxID=2630922 RepID=UPI003F4A48E5